MTALTVNPGTRLRTDSFISSGSHVRNCAGGITPWGTWLTRRFYFRPVL